MDRESDRTGRRSCSFLFSSRSAADAPVITAITRGTIAGRITLIMARTGQVIRGMVRTQAPSRSRLVIGRTIRAVRDITWAAAIMPGARDIGHGATAKESGFTAITLGDKRIQPRVGGTSPPQSHRRCRLSDGANQPPPRQAEPQGSCKTTESITDASAEIDRRRLG